MIITGGVHIHESMIRATFAMFPGRVALISDSMRYAISIGIPVEDAIAAATIIPASRKQVFVACIKRIRK